MKKLGVVIAGASGRMGQELRSLLEEDSRMQLVGTMDRQTPAGEVNKDTADVVVDFSLPEAFASVCNWCTENKVPLVSGTTGLTKTHFDLLERAAQEIPVLWSANMSLGVSVVMDALSSFSAIADYDYEIEEIHHSNKKDNPSGTALWLKQGLENTVKKTIAEPKGLRGGGVFGEHRVFAFGPEETICFEHKALNRRVFARGALRAAQWLVNQPMGKYQLVDLLRSK